MKLFKVVKNTPNHTFEVSLKSVIDLWKQKSFYEIESMIEFSKFIELHDPFFLLSEDGELYICNSAYQIENVPLISLGLEVMIVQGVK